MSRIRAQRLLTAERRSDEEEDGHRDPRIRLAIACRMVAPNRRAAASRKQRARRLAAPPRAARRGQCCLMGRAEPWKQGKRCGFFERNGGGLEFPG